LQGESDLCGLVVGAVMYPACLARYDWPLALMK
jgi:hypothetical protein